MTKPKFYKDLKKLFPEGTFGKVKYWKKEARPDSCCNKTGSEFIELNYFVNVNSRNRFRFVRDGFGGKWKIVKYDCSLDNSYGSGVQLGGGYVKGIKDLKKIIKLLSK